MRRFLWALVIVAGLGGLALAVTNATQRFGFFYTNSANMNANLERLDKVLFNAKQQRKGGTGCTTSASVGATCTDTITWNTAFTSTAYTVLCQCAGVTSGVPVVGATTTKAAGSIIVQTTAVTASAAQCSDIVCVALHD